MSTIRDVAALAGVSPSTVSRVLNHDTKYKITDETKEQIWKAVAATNYKAPAYSKAVDEDEVHVEAMPKHASKKFGCVLNTIGGKYNDPYYMTILSGFEKRIREKGYDIAFLRDNEEITNPEVLYRTFKDPVDGLLVMNTFPDDVFDYLKKQTSNIVGVDTTHTDIDNVAYNHYEVARMAVECLYNKGYREIGFIGGFLDNIYSGKRFKGYYAALNEFGLTFNKDYLIGSNWDDEHCEQEIKKAYQEGRLAKAYFASSDLMAMATLRSFYDLGLKVPEDVAIIGLTNIEVSKYSNPPLTTIELPAYDMGVVAADTLIERASMPTAPIKTVSLNSKLILRSTT